jgi:iron complex outermembrane recepter protein
MWRIKTGLLLGSAALASAAASAEAPSEQGVAPEQGGSLAVSSPGSGTGQAAAATDALDEVVVSGARKAQRDAIGDKFKAALIQDSVSQDDIGRLPDTTVVEAARRIPGVSIDLLTDNTRGRDEVQRASIRGFDAKYNLVTIDGSMIASVDPAALSSGAVTRAFNLNLLPASLVSAIQVTKTVTAESDAQALGGQVNLKTRSAFDSAQPFYADFNAFAGLDTSSGDSVNARSPSDRFSAILSDRFDFGGSRLGLTLASEYQDSISSSNGVTIGVPGATNQNNAGWTYYGTNGKSVAGPVQSPYAAVPTRFQVYSFDDNLEHDSVSGKIEFEQGEGFKSTLFAGYFASDSVETRNEDLLQRSPTNQISGTGVPGSGIPANLTPTSGTFISNDGQAGETYQPLKQNTDIVNWQNQYILNPSLTLNLDAAYSQAGGHLYRDMDKYAVDPVFEAQTGDSPLMAFTYNTSHFVPTVSFENPANWINPNNFGGLYWRYIHFDENDRVIDVQPNLQWNAGPGSTGLGGLAGVRFTSNSLDYRENYIEYDPNNPEQFLLTAAQNPKSIGIASWGVPLQVVNKVSADAVFANDPSAFTAANETANNNGNGFNFRERTSAAYIEGLFNADPFKVQTGVRFEHTDNDIGSLEQVANGVYAPIEDKSSYHSVLPSVVGSYQITADLIAHAAVTKTLGRPDPSAYGPLAKVGQPSAGQISITLGNPAIKPRVSTNYDASLDYYFDDRHSLISAQYFHKDLKNEFYNKSFSGPYTYAGQTYVGSFTEPENGATASVNGIELNLQKDRLEFIPERLGALGFGANYTRMWTDFTILDANGNQRVLHNLVNQPTYIGNGSVFYTYRRFELTVSYNIQGKTLFQTGAASWEDTYVLSRQQLDLTARYQITSHLTALFEGANLTAEPFRSAMGPTQQLVADDYSIGTQLWLGVNFRY